MIKSLPEKFYIEIKHKHGELGFISSDIDREKVESATYKKTYLGLNAQDIQHDVVQMKSGRITEPLTIPLGDDVDVYDYVVIPVDVANECFFVFHEAE